MMKLAVLMMCLCLSGFAFAHPEHSCASDATAQAKKLLAFHFGSDERMAIDEGVKVLKPLKNPAGRGEYDVLEVLGYIYKGTYRMRFISGRIPGECVLVGQEILEITSL
jgi:hypothetical protein